jgi:serine/threonine protein kinase
MTSRPDPPTDSTDDPRLLRAVQDYLADLEVGLAPDRSEYVRRHPEIAVPLAECLEALELVHRAAPVLPHPDSTGPAAGEPPTDLPKDPLGDFQIVRELGRGGMGVVYEAVQLSLGRRVALKVLPLAATFDAKCLQRFRNEAQAAALLHHTNIVPVYAVGCERGVHFYAMQLIEGQSLATVLAEVSQPQPSAETAAPLSRALSTYRATNPGEYHRALARLIIQAAEALEHAHESGIVHRDVKPANLLVDAHGRLWITDFGLAQFHTDAGLTRTGDVLGTLRYMSPEQASGRRVLLDHRTDVYSLGATLYELATLRPLCPGQSQEELLHQILHEEPTAPRIVEPRVPVELETIILKAVSKSPSDRYASAKELAADLGRYLEDRPIRAKRPGPVERVRKWCRRHPSVVVAAMLLLFFGALGFALTTFFVTGAYERERQRADEAEQRFDLAKRSADEMIRIAQEDLADNPMMQDARRRLLGAALAFYQEFIEQRRDRPKSQAELAETRDLVKKILDDLIVLQGAGTPLLLKDASVLDDLGASPEQRRQIRDLFEGGEWHRSLADLHKLPPEERQQRFLATVRADDAALATILTPAQLDRLRQIARQCQGLAAFRDEEVVRQLHLTPEQKRQIRNIEGQLFLEPPPFGPPGKRGGPGRGMREKQRAAVAQVVGLLSDPQKKSWRELTGRPFANAGDLFFLGGPGGFGPPPHIKLVLPGLKGRP